MKKDLMEVNFSGYGLDENDTKIINSSHVWLLPQIFAYIGKLNKFTYLDDGKIDSSSYMRNNFVPDSWHKGLYKYLMTDPRGTIVSQQNKSENRNYCALVPLILAAHKQYNDIPYSSWSKEGLDKLVNSSLHEMMVFTQIPEYTKEDLLEIRDKGLLVGSGSKRGTSRNPLTTFALYGLKNIDVDMHYAPALVKLVLTQIWCAHPLNRNEYMILDPLNWDNMPEPLEDSSIFVKEVETTSKKQNNFDEMDIPWA